MLNSPKLVTCQLVTNHVCLWLLFLKRFPLPEVHLSTQVLEDKAFNTVMESNHL